MRKVELIIKNDIKELERIYSVLEKLSLEWGFSDELTFDLNLVLEEYIVNIFNYGYSDDNIHQVKIEIGIEADKLILFIEDDGEPFNIIEATLPEEYLKPIEEREPGGLGIYLIKTIVDNMEYKREGGLNKLILIKNIKTENHE